MVAAIEKQARTLQHVSTLFPTLPIVELAETLEKLFPGERPAKMFFTNSGTEAIETAILTARLHTQRTEVIALRHGYHGRSMLSMSLTAHSNWRLAACYDPAIRHAMAPYCYRCPLGMKPESCGTACAQDVEDVIRTTTSGRPAAFIAEPIMGVGGFIVPPREYPKIVAEIVRRHEGLYIADEVQTGWGRTGGKWFGIEQYGVKPDIVVGAKSLGNGHPVGVTMARQEVADSFKGATISTFGGNPVTMAAAKAVVDTIAEERLMDNATDVGGHFRARFGQAAGEAPGDRRGPRDGAHAGARAREGPADQGAGAAADGGGDGGGQGPRPHHRQGRAVRERPAHLPRPQRDQAGCGPGRRPHRPGLHRRRHGLMTMFSKGGRRTGRLRQFLRRRVKARPERRPELDCKTFPSLFRKRAVVFTDTADFTLRSARDGILHFLMVFDSAAAAAKKVVRSSGGELVKVEGDSLLIRYDHVNDAVRGVLALDDAMQAYNRGRPENEQIHFSYGIGYGDILDIDDDMFGLEVNLACKIGEDLAEPGRRCSPRPRRPRSTPRCSSAWCRIAS